MKVKIYYTVSYVAQNYPVSGYFLDKVQQKMSLTIMFTPYCFSLMHEMVLSDSPTENFWSYAWWFQTENVNQTTLIAMTLTCMQWS